MARSADTGYHQFDPVTREPVETPPLRRRRAVQGGVTSERHRRGANLQLPRQRRRPVPEYSLGDPYPDLIIQPVAPLLRAQSAGGHVHSSYELVVGVGHVDELQIGGVHATTRHSEKPNAETSSARSRRDRPDDGQAATAKGVPVPGTRKTPAMVSPASSGAEG